MVFAVERDAEGHHEAVAVDDEVEGCDEVDQQLDGDREGAEEDGKRGLAERVRDLRPDFVQPLIDVGAVDAQFIEPALLVVVDPGLDVVRDLRNLVVELADLIDQDRTEVDRPGWSTSGRSSRRARG